MNLYEDAYAPFNRTRFVLLIILLCVVVFYYSSQAFVFVQADSEGTGCSFESADESCVNFSK